jgi:hypothetical protein
MKLYRLAANYTAESQFGKEKKNLSIMSEREVLVMLVTLDGEYPAEIFKKGIKLCKVGEIEKESKGGNKQIRNIIYLREPFA